MSAPAGETKASPLHTPKFDTEPIKRTAPLESGAVLLI